MKYVLLCIFLIVPTLLSGQSSKSKKAAPVEQQLLVIMAGAKFSACDGYIGMWGMDTTQLLQLLKNRGQIGWVRDSAQGLLFYSRELSANSYEMISFIDNKCDNILIRIVGIDIESAMGLREAIVPICTANFTAKVAEKETETVWMSDCPGGKHVYATLTKPDNNNAVTFVVTKR